MKYSIDQYYETMSQIILNEAGTGQRNSSISNLRDLTRADIDFQSGQMILFFSNLCDCSVSDLVSRFDHYFHSSDERDGFFIGLFFEALLQASVHCYAGSYFVEYLSKVKLPVKVVNHGTYRVRPQAILLNLTRLDSDRLQYIDELLQNHLPLWIKALDSFTAPGTGLQVLNGLAADRDVLNGYYHQPELEPFLIQVQTKIRTVVERAA